MIHEQHGGFPVVENGQHVGMVDLRNVQGVPPQTHVAAVMSRNLVTVPEDVPALDEFMQIGHTGSSRLAVVDRAGRMVGIVTKTDLMRAIQVRLATTQPREVAADAQETFDVEELKPVRNLP